MNSSLSLKMQNQPDDYSCGPTCLHAVYNYYQKSIDLQQLIDETEKLEDGGTLGVLLANHALERGFRARIYSYNLLIFDPTWFDLPSIRLREKLVERARANPANERMTRAAEAYIRFLDLGGELRFRDLNIMLIRKYLVKGIPILTGLSSTWLYRCARERDDAENMVYDDIKGSPCGHFVVLSGYDKEQRKVQISDPYHGNPAFETSTYWVERNRLINAILLGIVTYDSNLLIIQPSGE
ncbi:MAG: C39 family peptidase [Bacteroidetes bacterium]|nr:C39 family peptidase [Bacteroidota bacterium]